MCTHKIDIPVNAIVEIVLVDEGNGRTPLQFEALLPTLSVCLRSSTTEPEPSIPSAWLRIQRDWYRPVAGHEREENQFEARTRSGSARPASPTVQFAAN